MADIVLTINSFITFELRFHRSSLHLDFWASNSTKPSRTIYMQTLFYILQSLYRTVVLVKALNFHAVVLINKMFEGRKGHNLVVAPKKMDGSNRLRLYLHSVNLVVVEWFYS